VFPDYGLRFKYPGKVRQSRLFERFKIPHPRTRRWPSVEEFKDVGQAESRKPHEMPFFLKTDKNHEGEGIFLVTDEQSLEVALSRLEQIGHEGFISQEQIPCQGNVLRAVVLHRRILTYWKREDHGFISTVSHGARVDKKWKPALQEKGRAQAQWLCEKTGINLAAFDFVFNIDDPGTHPFILEINYYFGRRGLGGSLRYYRLLFEAIREWLQEKGLDEHCVKLV
jgi:ribosomal protein S6--L-glutamate ligase